MTSPQNAAPHTGPDRSLTRAGELAFLTAADNLTAEQLNEPSLLPGWNRATLLSHVAGNAEAFARAIRGALDAGDARMYTSREARDEEIRAGAQASREEILDRARASTEDLDALWSSLSPAQWKVSFINGQGNSVPITTTVKARAREIWVHLVDLDAGQGFEDVPAELAEAVLREVWASWNARGAAGGLAIATTASDGASLTLGTPEDSGTITVSGPLAAVTAWATGRRREGVTAARTVGTSGAQLASEPAELPAAPDWV